MLTLANVTLKLLMFIACVELMEGFPVIPKSNSNEFPEKATSYEPREFHLGTKHTYKEKPWWEWTIFDWRARLGVSNIMNKPLPEIIRMLYRKLKRPRPMDGSHGYSQPYSYPYPPHHHAHAVRPHSPSGAPHSYHRNPSDQHGQTVPPYSEVKQ